RGEAHFLRPPVQQLRELDPLAGLRYADQQVVRTQHLQTVMQQLCRLPDERPNALAAAMCLRMVVLERRRAHPVQHHKRWPTCHLPLTTCSCGSARYTSTAYCLTMWQPPSAQVQASIDPRGMSARTQPALVRAIGRWSLVALVLNSIIGSGVFGLPSLVAGL